MSDERLRELERAAREGDFLAHRHLMRERERRGEMLPDRPREDPWKGLRDFLELPPIWRARLGSLMLDYVKRFGPQFSWTPVEWRHLDATPWVDPVDERSPFTADVVVRRFAEADALVTISVGESLVTARFPWDNEDPNAFVRAFAQP